MYYVIDGSLPDFYVVIAKAGVNLGRDLSGVVPFDTPEEALAALEAFKTSPTTLVAGIPPEMLDALVVAEAPE